MDQQPRLASSALRYALRTLVLLGGVLVCWLLLSGGPAQASDGGPAPVVGQVAGAVTQPVHDLGTTTDSVTQTLRALPSRTTGTVTTATKDAPAPVRTTVETLTDQVEPVLIVTTSTVADTVDRSVHTTQALVVQAVHAALPHTVQGPPATSASRSTTATRVAAVHRHPSGARHAGHALATTSVGAIARSAATAPVELAPVGSAGQARGPHRESAPSIPMAPSAPTGSSSPAGVLAGLLLVPATLQLRRRSRGDADVPTGPAYPPGNSPG